MATAPAGAAFALHDVDAAGISAGNVLGHCGLLAAFAVLCLLLATRAFRAYQAQV